MSSHDVARLLLAQSDHPALSLARHFENNPGFGWRDVLILGGVTSAILLLFGGLALFARWRDRRRRRHPKVLFRELCDAHGLSPAQRRLLTSLARARRIPVAARLFLTPDAFRPSGLPPSWKSRSAELKQLEERLFEPAISA